MRDHLTFSVKCAEGDRTVWWHRATRFAKYVFKNIWSLTATPCINLRPRHGTQSIELPFLTTHCSRLECMFANSIKHCVSSEAGVCWVRGENFCFDARSQNCDKRLLASSCLSILSVRPNETTRLLLEGFS